MIQHSEIPEEVRKWALWRFGGPPGYSKGFTEVDPSRIVFVAKDKTSRCAGWSLALKRHPIPEGGLNPWRKSHTEHYWCWFLKYPEGITKNTD